MFARRSPIGHRSYGIIEIAAAVAMRRVIDNELWLGFVGFANVRFGLIVWILQGAGAVGIVWLIASYAFVFGVLLLMLGSSLRKYEASTIEP